MFVILLYHCGTTLNFNTRLCPTRIIWLYALYACIVINMIYLRDIMTTHVCVHIFSRSIKLLHSIIAYHRYRNNNNRKTTKVNSWTYFCFFVRKIDIFNISVVPAIIFLLLQILIYFVNDLKSIRYLKTVKFIIYSNYEQRSYIEFDKIIKYIIFKYKKYRILVRIESEIIKTWMGSSIRIVGNVC